jgi:hypothetical protein
MKRTECVDQVANIHKTLLTRVGRTEGQVQKRAAQRKSALHDIIQQNPFDTFMPEDVRAACLQLSSDDLRTTLRTLPVKPQAEHECCFRAAQQAADTVRAEHLLDIS